MGIITYLAQGTASGFQGTFFGKVRFHLDLTSDGLHCYSEGLLTTATPWDLLEFTKALLPLIYFLRMYGSISPFYSDVVYKFNVYMDSRDLFLPLKLCQISPRTNLMVQLSFCIFTPTATSYPYRCINYFARQFFFTTRHSLVPFYFLALLRWYLLQSS